MQHHKVKQKAYAKVNLALHVLGKRDDGFHSIDSVMVPISLHDEVRLEPTEAGITLSVHFAQLPSNAANLAYRAAENYLAAARIEAGVRISLDKHIPIAAGLGGGSSDAAAVLKGLQELYPSEVDIEGLALELGSDVPFFLRTGGQHVQGRGEVCHSFPLEQQHLVLVNPAIPVSAKEAYDLLEDYDPPIVLSALNHSLVPQPCFHLHNGLQKNIAKKYPQIAGVLQVLASKKPRQFLMSGSGSTCFALVHSAERAQRLAEEIAAEHPKWWVDYCHSL